VAARYIGTADAAQNGDLPLGERLLIVQPVAQPDDVVLSRCQAGHAFAHLDAGVPQVKILQHGVVHLDYIHKGERVAVSLRIQTVGQGHFPLQLALAAEIHEDLVFDAAAGIGGKPYIFVRLEGGDPLDEADGADGNEVVLISALGVVFLDDVCHQPQVVLNELFPGILVAFRHSIQTILLLLPGQGTGEGACITCQP